MNTNINVFTLVVAYNSIMVKENFKYFLPIQLVLLEVSNRRALTKF
jgi:hypothetical protein